MTRTALPKYAYVVTILFAAQFAPAADWPRWGGDNTNNMVSREKNLPHEIVPGEFKQGSEEVDLATTRNVKWVVKLGSETYGNPTVANGRIFVGTNNESPRDPKIDGDHGIIYCLEEATGKLLWQLAVPKLGAGKVSDWEFLGVCSSPTVDGNRVYIVTNRCEALCLDVEGMANGNDGPFKDEGQYMAGPDQTPLETGPLDADIIWVYPLREELGVFPHNIASSSILVAGDKLAVTTSNGVDWSHSNIPAPFAPALVLLNKNTGALLGEENAGVSQRLMHCNWSSPAYMKTGDREQIVWGAGDGFCYGFGMNPVKNDEGYEILPELWRYDCNPPHYRRKDGEPIKYATSSGPSEVIASPVIYQGKIYVTIGQDPEHGDGVGNLVCIDPADKTGEITQSGRVWVNSEVRRSISTCAIADDLVYVADYAGRLFCLDALTGKQYWAHPTGSHVWSSPFVADGKIYLGNEEGVLTIMKTGKEPQVLSTVEFPTPIYSTAIAANGVLYLATRTHLYAFQQN